MTLLVAAWLVQWFYSGRFGSLESHTDEHDMAGQLATQTMKITDVKQQLNSLVNRVYRREARVIVEKSGIPVAGIVSAEDLRRLEQLDQERAERFAILEEFGEAFKDAPAEELEREVARALAEKRSRRRGAGKAAATATT